MENRVYSDLLDEMLKVSKSVGEKNSGACTAEKFLVVLFDTIEMLGENVKGDLMEAAKMLSELNIDIKKARRMLMTYIQDSKYEFLDACYMNSVINEASKAIEGELNVTLLLYFILKKPSQPIAELLETATMTKAEDDKGDFDFESLFADETERVEEKPSVEKKKDGAGDLSDLKNRLNSIKVAMGRPEAEPKTEAETHDEERPEIKRGRVDPRRLSVFPVEGDIEENEEEIEDPKGRNRVEALISEVALIHDKLSDTIFGQEHAIDVFTSGYFQAELLAMTDKSRRKPGATFLFAGPPGVGKTFLAESVASLLERPFMRFDMSEYGTKEAALEFCGSDSVYKDSKGGNFTTFVKENPVSVVLFDEIEKAHTSIIHLFLQILDAGRIRDNNTDEEIALNNVILIFTTNAGRQLYEESDSGDFSNTTRKVILKALENDINPLTKEPFFPSAICSRFASGNVVMFNHMGAHNLQNIVKRELNRHAKNYETEFGVKIEIDDKVATSVMFAEGGSADARTVRSRAESFFDNEIFELFRMIAAESCDTCIGDVEDIRINVQLPESGEVLELFEAREKAGILTFASDKVIEKCRTCAGDIPFFGSGDVKEADRIIKNNDIGIVIVDLNHGVNGGEEYLNVEDTSSTGRDFLRYVRETYSDIPVYLIDTDDFTLEKEEKRSLLAQGVRGVLSVKGADNSFAEDISVICYNIHQQNSMKILASENKVVTFETAQKVSEDGKTAEIVLFDFALRVAVDAEDSDTVISDVSRPNVSFEQVIGADDAKVELRYFIDYLKNPKKFLGTGVKAPKGVLLYGPPGTGKTMLAKAMAAESGVTFISAEGNQFLKSLVGEGSEAVHEIFATARKYAPSILFIDEIDAIAKKRTGGNNGTEAVAGNTLTALLTEMDGFRNDTTKPVFVLAATNFDVDPDSPYGLDGALMRRFDRRIYVDLPNKNDRIKFMKLKISKNPTYEISESVIESIAIRSAGMSLANLDSVFEMALRTAIRTGEKVTDAVFEESFEGFNGGEKKVWNAELLERVARHESGHALLCWLKGEKPSYITIVARGDHGGYMQHDDMEGKYLFTKEELLGNIRTALGGRAAEIVYYGEEDGLSTGASGDLYNATQTARRMICSYGMDEDFGLAMVGQEGVTGELADEVRARVNEILKEQMDLAIATVKENKKAIDVMVDTLMVKNHLIQSEIDEIFTNNTKK